MRVRTVATVLPIVTMMGCDRFWGLGDPYQDAGSAVSFVQLACVRYPNNNGGNPFTITVPDTAPGNLLIATTSHAGGSGTLLAFSDDGGHDFTRLFELSFQQEAQMLYLPDIPGGTTVITATPDASAVPPIRMCIEEYTGADRTAPIAMKAGKRLNTGTLPQLETVDVGPVIAPERGIISIAVFDVHQAPITPAIGSFEPHDSILIDSLFEDTRASLSAGQAVATIDSTTIGQFDPWAALAVAIQPPP